MLNNRRVPDKSQVCFRHISLSAKYTIVLERMAQPLMGGRFDKCDYTIRNPTEREQGQVSINNNCQAEMTVIEVVINLTSCQYMSRCNDIEVKGGLTVLSKSMKINGGLRLDYGENTIDFAV